MKTKKSEARLQGLLDELKKDTLDPALKEAEKIKRDARGFADQLIADAKAQKERLLADAEKEIEQKKQVFQKALESAKRQAVDRLRSEIEVGIFNPEMRSIINEISDEEKIVRAAIEVMVKSAAAPDIAASVSEKVDVKQLAQSLTKAVAKKLEGKIHPLKGLKGGAQLRVEKEGMTLDLSAEVISELIESYTRSELRGLLFGQELMGG